MLASLMMIVLGSIGVAFGPQKSFNKMVNYIIYTICRFFIACGTRGINVTGFVLGINFKINLFIYHHLYKYAQLRHGNYGSREKNIFWYSF